MFIFYTSWLYSSVGKESAHNAGDLGSIPGSGRSPGKGNGNPLQDSCLENPMDRGVWRATVRGVTRVEYNLVIKQTHANIHYTHTSLYFRRVDMSFFLYGLTNLLPWLNLLLWLLWHFLFLYSGYLISSRFPFLSQIVTHFLLKYMTKTIF